MLMTVKPAAMSKHGGGGKSKRQARNKFGQGAKFNSVLGARVDAEKDMVIMDVENHVQSGNYFVSVKVEADSKLDHLKTILMKELELEMHFERHELRFRSVTPSGRPGPLVEHDQVPCGSVTGRLIIEQGESVRPHQRLILVGFLLPGMKPSRIRAQAKAEELRRNQNHEPKLKNGTTSAADGDSNNTGTGTDTSTEHNTDTENNAENICENNSKHNSENNTDTENNTNHSTTVLSIPTAVNERRSFQRYMLVPKVLSMRELKDYILREFGAPPEFDASCTVLLPDRDDAEADTIEALLNDEEASVGSVTTHAQSLWLRRAGELELSDDEDMDDEAWIELEKEQRMQILQQRQAELQKMLGQQARILQNLELEKEKGIDRASAATNARGSRTVNDESKGSDSGDGERVQLALPTNNSALDQLARERNKKIHEELQEQLEGIKVC